MKRVLLSAVALLIACLSWENADAQRKPREVQEQAIKYQRLMQMIDAAYVDTVNLKKLTEDAIVKVQISLLTGAVASMVWRGGAVMAGSSSLAAKIRTIVQTK